MTKDSDFLENEIFLPRPKMLQSGVMWKASHMQPGWRARFRALEALGFSVLKYAFFHFLETLFLSFLTFTSTPKMDKVVLSIWISEKFLCYYTLCKFDALLKMYHQWWKFIPVWGLSQCLIFYISNRWKKITAEVSMLQEIKAGTKKQTSLWYTLVP